MTTEGDVMLDALSSGAIIPSLVGVAVLCVVVYVCALWMRKAGRTW